MRETLDESRRRAGSVPPVRALVRRGGRRRAARAQRDDARHRRRRRPARPRASCCSRASTRAASRSTPTTQSRKGRELAARRRAPRCCSSGPISSGRCASRATVEQIDRRRVRRLFRGPPARRRGWAHGRRRRASRSRAARRSRRVSTTAEARYRGGRRRGSAAAALGRLSPRPRCVRVLAGSRARACTIASAIAARGARRARWVDRPAGAVRRRSAARRPRARSPSLIRLGHREPHGAGGEPRRRLARRAVARRVAVHGRRADGALRVAARCCCGRGGRLDRPHRRAQADAASARSASRSAAALPFAFPGLPSLFVERDAARRRVHGVPGRRAVRDGRDRRRPRRGRAISGCWRSATRCRGSSAR